MFRNNLKIAWRNLLKDRQFTFLNILGLSAGLACALLIFLWVKDEISFDKFNEKDDQIFQLMERRKNAGNQGISDESSGILGETMAQQMPEIEYAAALAPPEWFQKFTLSVSDRNIKAVGQYAGKDYFNIFSFKLLEGKPSTVLADKNSIVLSDELARKLFGTTDQIIGRKVRFQQERDFFVSGVFGKVPSHSSQQFDFVLSFEYLKDVQGWVRSWYNTGPHNFVLLKKGVTPEAFNKKIAGFFRRLNSNDSTRTAFAMRFSGAYLANTFVHGARTGGRQENVRLFSLIALFILVIACINFMNLSTAKASRRLKEVGIKKVVGAGRRQLIFQFLAESILLTLFATLFAVLLAWALLPAFNQLTAKHILLDFDPVMILSLFAITLLTGLLAGSYPALYLSGFNPVEVLKGKIRSSLAEVSARKGLVVFQFTLSMILIVAVLVVYRQIQFIQSTDPGYQKDNVLRISSEGKLKNTEEEFVVGLKKIPGVVNASFTFNSMAGRNFGNTGVDWDGKDPDEAVYFEGFSGGYDLVETMGMQMAAGRSFSREYGADSAGILLNETAIQVMHLKDPVGKTIRLFRNPMRIIGVLKDFHFESLRENVKPSYMVLQTRDNAWFKIMTRIQVGQERPTIERIRKYYEAYNPGFPFEFNFLDEAYQQQYITEVRVATLSRYFAGLAILISCLGLFGLTAFTAQKRQKEIGIRKVVGASVGNIVSLLSADFLKLILIAVLIAFPLSWWTMSQWLNGFAYRIDIGPGIFLLAGIAVLFITLLTISYQALRAAVADPIKSLRSE